MAEEQQTPPISLLDNPLAPTVFAGAAMGFFTMGGNIMITFEAPHIDHTKEGNPITRVVIGRLVMPTGGAADLATGLFDFLKKQGFDFSAGVASAPH